MAKIHRTEVTISGIAETARKCRERTATTPFGEVEGMPIRYSGRSVAWKCSVGRYDEAAKEVKMMKAAALSIPPARVLAGLAKAIKDYSKACADIKGTTIFEGRVYPRKVVCQMLLKRKYTLEEARRKAGAA